jgi:hypothetical protein
MPDEEKEPVSIDCYFCSTSHSVRSVAHLAGW